MAELLIDAHWLLIEARELLDRDGWTPRPVGAAGYGTRHTGWCAAGAVYAAARFVDQGDGVMHDPVSEDDFARWRECRSAFRALCSAIGVDVTHLCGDMPRARVSDWSDRVDDADTVRRAYDIAIANTTHHLEVA